MTIKDYISIECPKKCGVHPAFGKVALLVFEAELNGEKEFSQENFFNCRDRAKLGLPYKPVNELAYEHCLKVLTLCIMNHRIKKHDEKFNPVEAEPYDIGELSKEELSMVASEWWNG